MPTAARACIRRGVARRTNQLNRLAEAVVLGCAVADVAALSRAPGSNQWRVTGHALALSGDTATISVPVDFVEIEPADNNASDANIVVPEVIFLDGFEQPDPPISVPMR